MRYSDNQFWNSTTLTWGASFDLPATFTRGSGLWQVAPGTSLPSGGNLAEGYYLITVRGRFEALTKESGSLFTVGAPAPPVLPAAWAWGDGERGRLGSGNTGVSSTPVPVFTRGALDGKVIGTVAAGYFHTLVIDSGGAVFAWGNNTSHEIGTTSPQSEFLTAVKVDDTGALAGKRITGIGAGHAHSLALSSTGEVFAWGSDSEGQVGDNGGTGSNVHLPTPVMGLLAGKRIIAVSAGYEFSLALSDQGKLYAWGENAQGQLGEGFTNARSSEPVAVTGLDSVVIVAVDAGNDHSLALDDSGKIYAWGYNDGGQVGNGTTVDASTPVLISGPWGAKKIIAISAGGFHSLAVAEDGKVYAWGHNNFGQLGTGDTTDHNAPVQVTALDGMDVVGVEAGFWKSSFAWTRDNKVFSWGANDKGQLARATTPANSSSTPQEANTASALSGGRYVLGLSAGSEHVEMLTGFTPRPLPEIEVEAKGIELTDGGPAGINFGSVGQGSSNSIFITVRNRGSADLTDLSASVSGAGFSGVFVASSIAPNGETGFYVNFNPNVTGAATGTMQIFSNDADENPFDITLTGSAYPVGKVDLTIDPQMDGNPDAISVQPDGKVVVGGSFFNVGPVARNRCARLDATTGAADSFNPDVDNFISCSLVLPDGKVMIGGFFTAVGGVGRNKLARLNPDGTLDTTYNAQLSGSFGVTGMALQSDGKLIVVGNISLPGQSFIVRLNPDGSRDGSFAPVLNSPPRGVAVRGDGQVLIWGQFTTVNGASYSRVAMLNGADGSTDPSFNDPLIVISGIQIDAAALQPNGKILVGGQVQSVNGTPINGMCRLNTDGSLDSSFDPNVDGRVNSIALQADGSMIICGLFSHVGGQPRNRIAKISANGSYDFYFDPNNTGSSMNAVMLQADGKVLCTPSGSIAGEPRTNMARLSNSVATQSLSMTNNGTTIEWLRDGASPEAHLVTFDVSTDGGTTWVPVGAASRVAFPSRGWTLTNGGLPPTGHIRARAYAQGARYNGSSSIMETISAYGTPPDITITEGTIGYENGYTRLFGVVATGSASSVFALTIQNTGGSPLTGLSGATIEDNNLSDGKDYRSMFQLIKPSSSSIAPGGTANLSVTYRPKTSGRHTAILRIPSNDPDENPFIITISGQGSEPFTTYKERLAGDTALPDATITHFKSGQSLLSAYATGTTDSSTDGDGTSITAPTGGGSGFAPASFFGQSPAPSPGGGVFFFNYRRNKLALADVIYQVEWSDTLAPNDWHTDDVTEEITSDDDSIQRVQATVPAGTAGHRFVRLRMTRL